jgi:DNA replication protein DnaC
MTNPPLLRVRDPLGSLKLCTAQARLETLRHDASAQEIIYADCLERLLTEASTAKGEKAVAMRTVMARFPDRTTLESFDDGVQPAVARKTLQALATGRFLEHGDNIVFLGPPGTGTTHWAIGLGLKAVQQGHRTRFTSALSRIATLTNASADKRFEDCLTRYPVPTLLIIDEMGDIPIDRHGAHLCFQLIARRDARGAIIRTANQSFGQWAEVFGDPIVATAILDRLLHHSHVINIKGDSYRLRETQQAGRLKTASMPDTLEPEGWVIFQSLKRALFQ